MEEKSNKKKEKFDIKKIIKKKEKSTLGKKKQKKDKFSSQFSIVEVVLLMCIVSMVSIGATIAITYQVFKSSSKIVYKEMNSDLKTIAETYDYVIKNYYGELDKKELISGAIRGMLEAVGDPNTVFVEDTDSNLYNVLLQGDFKGIGVQISNVDNNIVVVGVVDNSPALRAGVKIGDILLKVDNIDLAGMATTDFVDYVATVKDGVTILLKRGEEELELKVDKELVTLSSVKSSTFEKGNKKTGYIGVSLFANNTAIQFREELIKLESQNIDSLIIDLRSNSGGHLTAAKSILDLFLNSDKVVYQLKDNQSTSKVYSTGNKDVSYKIVLLVDSISASASEIVTAGLSENLGSYIIGTTTYGKGTVQELQTLASGLQYKFTTKHWLTPNGNWINGVGIKPDLEVKLSDEYVQNPSNETDNQLQAALDYLNSN